MKNKRILSLLLAAFLFTCCFGCEKTDNPEGASSPSADEPGTNGPVADGPVADGPDLPETTPFTPPVPPSYPLDDKYERGELPRVYIDTSVEVPNLAYGCALRAEGETDDGSATDSSPSTAWHSAGDGETTLFFDLGKEVTAGYIQIAWGTDAGKRYEVQISSDGANDSGWTTLKTEESGYRSKHDHIEFEPVSFRYLRLVLHESSRGGGYELTDLYVMESRMPTTGRATITTGDYVPVKVAVVDREGGTSHTIEETAGIRIRGNSTAASDKKPYNIKFENKKTLLGIKGSRKWCLLANHFDKTLIRNKLAYDFCKTAGVPCYLESAMVEVFVDGAYKGLYQLTEPVSDAKTSVNIDVDAGEYLIERNGYYNFDPKWNHSPLYGIRFVPAEPEVLSEAKQNTVGTYLREADYAAKSKSFKRIEAIFDVDSFVSFYICEELLKDIDLWHGSTYFYIKGGKIYSGPMWDMDLSMGNVSRETGIYTDGGEKYRIYWNLSNWRGQSFGDGSDDSTSGFWAQVDWYGPLMQCEEFAARVRAKYAELQPAIRDLYEDGGYIDRLMEECRTAALRDYTDYGTRLDMKYFSCEYDVFFSDYDESVQYLKDWLRARNEWLCGAFGIDTEP